MWLWAKKKRMDCKEWKNQHFENTIGKKTSEAKKRDEIDQLEDAEANTRDPSLRPTTSNRRGGGD